jgi:hypothetical protein
MLAAVATAATQTRGYNWDNGNTNYWLTGPSHSNLVTNPSCAANVGAVIADPDVNFPANKILTYTKATGSTESLYLVHVEGLLNNDTVIITYKLRNGAGTGKTRSWVAEDNHFGNANPKSGSTWNNCTPYDFNYNGNSNGPTTYVTNKTAWESQSYAYTFSTAASGCSNATGVLFEVRYYGAAGSVCYVDDIQVSCPDYCTVMFPDGSYGYDATPVSLCLNPPFGDLDYDCVVGMKDMGLMAANWLVSDVNDLSTEFPSGVQNLGYGWQDMGSVLDPNLALISIPSASGYVNTFNYPGFMVVAAPNHATPYSLECIQGNGGNGELYVAQIDGLYSGDKVAASVWLKSGNTDTNGGSGSGQQHLRLWAVYTSLSNGRYAGSAGGDEAYSLSDWKRFSHEWTFDAGSPTRGGMVIEIRAYGKYRDVSGYIDDLVISAPAGATVTFPNSNLGSTTTQAPVCASRPFGDLNVDCVVNMADFAMMAANWLKCGLSAGCP